MREVREVRVDNSSAHWVVLIFNSQMMFDENLRDCLDSTSYQMGLFVGVQSEQVYQHPRDVCLSNKPRSEKRK